jgi:DNA modification methylase
LGDHKLLCGDALIESSYKTLMDNEKAQMCFLDSPYNVRIDGHVGNSGNIKHREFEMASGEMNKGQFTEFLAKPHQHIATYSKDGAIIFSCMDWRHIREIMDAAQAAKLEMINLCCWRKDNAGMGSLYRSQHELVFVFKNGKGKHINNVALGSNGRYRTNVWQYPGVNSFGGDRMNELKMHPTVKPTAMVVDAIKDCSRRGGIILDPFGGSGTTLIAAEKTARKARLIELDPRYCDVTIRRWQDLTGQDAIHAESGKTFNEIQELGEI